jgi:hypothetical protein
MKYIHVFDYYQYDLRSPSISGAGKYLTFLRLRNPTLMPISVTASSNEP